MTKRRVIFGEPFTNEDPPSNSSWLIGGMAHLSDPLPLANAYKEAGDILAAKACADEEGYRLLLPTLFNYRHAVELFLKAGLSKRTGHSLSGLLAELDDLLAKRGQGLPGTIRETIREFDEFDRRSTAFRYSDTPVHSFETGEPGEFLIHLPSLRLQMDALANYFTSMR